ncbi:MAG TPA: patatin-like phospholipase family protein [Candidatus Angelobacter sp.]
MGSRATKKRTAAALEELETLREEFRREIASPEKPTKFTSRIGVVLSGGGARGAYEAGVLMAFQDAKVPTHIITAASVGSINAASFAAHSEGFVGNAEVLVRSWLELTPLTLGIDWSRYIFLLAGLIAASAGLGNFFWNWMESHGIYLHAHHPAITWLSLAAAGIAILLSADTLPYAGYVALNVLRGRRWEPDEKKAWFSLGANLLVWGFVILFLDSTHVHLPFRGLSYFEFTAGPLAIVVLLVFWLLRRLFRGPLNTLSHRFLRLPLRTGLFANFDRLRFLRARLPEDGLRRSAIHVLMTATDLQGGSGRYFSNVTPQELLRDPDVQHEFVLEDVECPRDLVLAMVASSAYTFAYEAVPMEGRLWTDGGVVTNQPIRPALRLGADVLFLVMLEPLKQENIPAAVKTFLDVGIHAVDILISKNLKADMAMLNNLNRLCSVYAKELGVKPEQLELEIGSQHYSYVKAFNIAPEKPLPASALDFDGEIICPVIIQGYRDACKVLKEFLMYEAQRPSRESRRVVHLSAERPEGNFHVTAKEQGVS